MNFSSDNTSPAHPAILEALTQASHGYASAYGDDPWMAQLRDKIRSVFDAPNAEVHLVATGTSANSLALACLAEPWSTVFCTPQAHINVDECNAPEFYTGGAKLTLVGQEDKMSPEALRTAIEGEEIRGVHGAKRGPVSVTQVTERGQVYSIQELKSLCFVAKSFDLAVHMDGARFANAVVSLGCSPAELSKELGIDVLVFGGTKNGLLGVEAVIFFDPDQAASFAYRRKRAGHLFSKNRYLSAQFLEYLNNDLWKALARHANGCAARLARGLERNPKITLNYPVQANMIFADMPRAFHQKLFDAGFAFYVWSGELAGSDPNELLTARLVTSWDTQDKDIDQFLRVIAAQ